LFFKIFKVLVDSGAETSRTFESRFTTHCLRSLKDNRWRIGTGFMC